MTDIPLEQRAGSNIGTQVAWWPRAKTGKSKTLPIVPGGDTVIFVCPDDVETLLPATLDFFNNSALPSPLPLQVIIVSPNGLEHPLFQPNIAALAGGVTGFNQLSPLLAPMALTPGEKLIVRAPGAPYVGGCVVEASCGKIFGGHSTRQAIGTQKTVIIEPPEGKSLGAVNGGIDPTAPLWFFNTDTGPNPGDGDHTLTIYHTDKDGVDTLLFQGLLLTAGSGGRLFINSLGAGEKIKATINSPIVTPGRSVVAASFYQLYDAENQDFA